MKILYIYPHPDDESFGPAHAMSKQRREGHEVYLLTLTEGGATRQRHALGYSIEEMGKIRKSEMQDVARVLDLSGMTVMDLPDSGLKEMDPAEIEKVIKQYIEKIKPDVVVTYPVHGISGFHDHLVCHAVVKRVYTELKKTSGYLRRLAFITISEDQASRATFFHLSGSKEEEIDCIYTVEQIDQDNCRRALDCYLTFQETIEKSGIKSFITAETLFEIFQEDHTPPLNDLFDFQ
jgi:N-acetylglucosamine malate deacetylase 2